MDGAGRLETAQAAQDSHRLLIEAITDYAIYMLDPNGLIVSWNPGAQRFKGYTAREIVGQHFSRFYTDEDRAAGMPASALRIAREEGRFESEGWRVRKDGTRFWAQVVIDPIRSLTSGALIGYAKVTRDLTERRAAEQALRQSEEQFRLLVQGVTDYAIYMLDPEGRVSSWNAGAERIKGYRPDEIIGQHFSRFYTPEDQAAALPQLGLATATREGRWEREGQRVRKDGTRFWAHVIIDAIHDERGRLLGFAKITRDVTERREAQQALEEARERLLQSQKMDAIGQFTGGVAHDFNNLLMAILGSLELVKKRLPADIRITPLVDNAIEGAQRGAVLTQRMLAFARKQELKLEAVDLATLVGDIRGFLQRSIGPSIRIDVDFPADLPPVRTDANQLETALLNLAVNARDAMPDGGVITISARREPFVPAGSIAASAGDFVRLVVADTGEGMDDTQLARATEPFFTTKGVGKGTGLGLSMVHGLAGQSGGHLALASRPGEGTAISLWLPVADGRAEEDGEGGKPPAGRGRRGLRILAVDDDSLVLVNTAALLDDLGHQVISAASGREALDALRHHPDLDLVITDYAMPQINGLQLRDAIHATRPELPVLVATGYAEFPADADTSLRRIAKPFTQDELAAAVAESCPALKR